MDNRKTYDFLPHSWIGECMELFGIVNNVRNVLQKSMIQWIGDRSLKKWQDESLSALLFIVLSLCLSQCQLLIDLNWFIFSSWLITNCVKKVENRQIH